MEGQSQQQQRREQLKLAGLCPCCGRVSCSELDEQKSRLRAKLEARRAQVQHCDGGAACVKPEPCHQQHKYDSANIDATLKWVEAASNARRRAARPPPRQQRRHHQKGAYSHNQQQHQLHRQQHHHHHHHEQLQTELECDDATTMECADASLDAEVDAFALLLSWQSCGLATRMCLPGAIKAEVVRQCKDKL